MIPKIIHYCWFGRNEKTEEIKNYILKWKCMNPDYLIMEWNEDNFSIEKNTYVQEAYHAKKWAFVSDYVRLYALYEYGGIYLDTDVDVLKPFDSLLNSKAFIGAESQFSMCTATLGAEKNSLFIRRMLDDYVDEHFYKDGRMDTIPNSQRFYDVLTNEYGYLFDSEIIQDLGECVVYPQIYFSPINCYTYIEEKSVKTISVHRYAGSWKSKKEKIKDRILAAVTKIIGEKNRSFLKKWIKG